MRSMRIEPGYKGPTLLELESTLVPDHKETVEVRWENSRAEQSVLRRWKHEKDFVLVVSDLTTMSRTAHSLGLPLQLSDELIASVGKSLNEEQGGNWRQLSSTLTPQISGDAVVGLASKNFRRGKYPRYVRRIATEVLMNNVNPTDAEVLMDLAMMGATG